MEKPFIYISGLRRTGSTLLCEAMSYIPYCFIFTEPNFAKNQFTLRKGDAEMILTQGIDLYEFQRRWSGIRRYLILNGLKNELAPRLDRIVAQFGVKEIFHSGWTKYHQAFPNMKVILTARDPRDIFISLYRRHQKGNAIWTGPFTPERVAANLNAEFRRQQEMALRLPSFKVRYEDLCQSPEILGEITTFTETELPEMGQVGSFTSRDPRRVGEYELHGDRITARRVYRWKDEPDTELRAQAFRVAELMPEYCAYWGYS
jgi:hypothetical protein